MSKKCSIWVDGDSNSLWYGEDGKSFRFSTILFFLHKVEKYGEGKVSETYIDPKGYCVENFRYKGAIVGYFGYLPTYYMQFSDDCEYVAITNFRKIKGSHKKVKGFIDGQFAWQDSIESPLENTMFIRSKDIGRLFKYLMDDDLGICNILLNPKDLTDTKYHGVQYRSMYAC